MDNFNLKNFINENNLGAYSKLEGQKRDVDGDGDIDSDDYMAAKDAAIKKAMGKNEAIADPDSLTSIIMGGLAAVGAVKALPKLVDLLGDESGDITIDSLKKALSKKDVKCYGGQDGVIEITAYGGTGVYNYEINVLLCHNYCKN